MKNLKVIKPSINHTTLRKIFNRHNNFYRSSYVLNAQVPKGTVLTIIYTYTTSKYKLRIVVGRKDGKHITAISVTNRSTEQTSAINQTLTNSSSVREVVCLNAYHFCSLVLGDEKFGEDLEQYCLNVVDFVHFDTIAFNILRVLSGIRKPSSIIKDRMAITTG